MDHLGRRDARPAGCSTDPGRPPGYARHGRARGKERSMNRRDFLGLLTGGVAGGVLAKSAVAQGASANEIRIGMSAAFRGSAAGLGAELYRGAQAYYSEINARGGVFGRSISVVALAENYNPEPCIRNTIQLLDREKVFFLSNYVGTPTLTRALPVIKQYADQNVVLVGNFTGAQPQREAPYVDQVFNVRASYRQEMQALVERFWQAGARRFGVYYQVDAYGRSGTDGVARALAARDARIVADAMLALLVKHGRAKGRDYTRGLINSQVVPSYDDTTLPGVAEYRALMDKHNPPVPEGIRDAQYAPGKYSFISLEGYVNARVITEALKRAGANAGRPGFRQALESLRGLDLGIGAPLTFTPERHQGLDSVYFTRVDSDHWVPIVDWSAAVKV